MRAPLGGFTGAGGPAGRALGCQVFGGAGLAKLERNNLPARSLKLKPQGSAAHFGAVVQYRNHLRNSGERTANLKSPDARGARSGRFALDTHGQAVPASKRGKYIRI
nr:hypothetical protein [Actinobaculum massiliense]